MMDSDNILKSRNQNESLKIMQNMQSIKDESFNLESEENIEKENFNPKTLKELSSHFTNDEMSAVAAATTFVTEKSTDFTDDENENEDSFQSTKDSLSFLTEGLNKMALGPDDDQQDVSVKSDDARQDMTLVFDEEKLKEEVEVPVQENDSIKEEVPAMENESIKDQASFKVEVSFKKEVPAMENDSIKEEVPVIQNDSIKDQASFKMEVSFKEEEPVMEDVLIREQVSIHQDDPVKEDVSMKEKLADGDHDFFKIPETAKREQFQNAVTYNFGDSDFDFLQNYGKTAGADSFGRDSVLMRFDPLLEKPLICNESKLPITTEEEEEEHFSESFCEEPTSAHSSANQSTAPHNPFDDFCSEMKDIDLESNSALKDSIENNDSSGLSLSSHQPTNSFTSMTEQESQIRKEAEMKEEALLKRISDKDKQIAKMNNVVEAYEKAISELIAEKEQLIQSYDKKCTDLKGDSETNSHHLASLESTFSDLHAKYERLKQIAAELKEREEINLQERKTLAESLKMQELRYEKMKMHAMTQLEIANNKLAEMMRNHQADVTKLKAQLKKEEISRASINEQLIQKSKENAELVKICDELIGHSQNA